MPVARHGTDEPILVPLAVHAVPSQVQVRQDLVPDEAAGHDELVADLVERRRLAVPDGRTAGADGRPVGAGPLVQG